MGYEITLQCLGCPASRIVARTPTGTPAVRNGGFQRVRAADGTAGLAFGWCPDCWRAMQIADADQRELAAARRERRPETPRVGG